MIKKKFSKLIGLSLDDFNAFRESKQIIAQEARLIPLLKTGDERALCSIFLSGLKLIDEFRNSVLKELKMGRSGKKFYFTEVAFNDIDSKSRIDGLVIVVLKNKIIDAVIFEVKNKNNSVDKDQIDRYIGLAKNIGIKKLCSISNEFVADSSQSPVNAKAPKNFQLNHFSWTYLMTMGQLLLFKNERNIQDEDQVEIMKEVLYYFDDPQSGINGYHQMKPGWKETVEKIASRVPLKTSDQALSDAVLSWYEEEKDMALLLSRKLGVLVKSTSRNKDSFKSDLSRLISDQELLGNLSVRDSVSDIKIKVDFEVKCVSMSVKIAPPQDKGTTAKITWMSRQLEAAKKKSEDIFPKIESDILVEANIKHAREAIRVRLSDYEQLLEDTKGREIKSFNIVQHSKFGAGFGSNKNFIVLIENMALNYYAGIVQHMTNWNRPAPKL